ncbi:MAG TPA: hypothetical protein VEY11_01205 [Pyrinomonadaceae bacterium]|nr:hypothetical protein [Pyrinomonadaceae bacterium]
MKKYLLTVMLTLAMPFISLSQEPSRKPASKSTEKKKTQQQQPSKGVGEGEETVEIKLGQPKRVSTKAFIDLLNKGRSMVESGEIDLNAPIEMEVSAVRSRNGTLSNIGINQKIIAAPQRELAKEFIEALSSSGALEFLEGIRGIVFTLRLNGDTLSLSASSELPSAKKAAQWAHASTMLLEVGASVKRGRDEEIIYKGASVSANGKRLTATLSLPRGTVADLLSKQLQSSSGQ